VAADYRHKTNLKSRGWQVLLPPNFIKGRKMLTDHKFRIRTAAAALAAGSLSAVLGTVLAPTTVLADQFFAQTASMAPGISAGETVKLDKSAYAEREPVAGDIVVYTLSWSSTVFFAHRVIGVGGDTVQLTDGVVTLNGRPITTVADGIHKGGTKTFNQTRETLPNGRSYLVLHEPPLEPAKSTPAKAPPSDFVTGPMTPRTAGPFTVPSGHYFVLGDNRDTAADSRRKDGGFLPRAAILGRLTEIISSSKDGRDGAMLD
jgi:signal peptidase I